MLLRFETTASQMPNFALFNPLCKIRGGVGQISKSIFRAIIYATETCFRFPIARFLVLVFILVKSTSDVYEVLAGIYFKENYNANSFSEISKRFLTTV